jgi:hypothetical protein
MAQDDNIWRALVNSLPETPEDGEDAPSMEKIPKKRGSRKFFVQKIVTEIYVYTDLQDQKFSEACFQDLYLLGEMTEAKLNRLLLSESKRREKDAS